MAWVACRVFGKDEIPCLHERTSWMVHDQVYSAMHAGHHHPHILLQELFDSTQLLRLWLFSGIDEVVY
jgi:hypothetical protein